MSGFNAIPVDIIETLSVTITVRHVRGRERGEGKQWNKTNRQEL